MTDSSPQAYTKAQVALGLFVCWQLGFLLVSNLWGLLLTRPPEIVYELSDEPVSTGEKNAPAKAPLLTWLMAPTERWEELTGQWQGWMLFAPGVNKQAAFINVELHWSDGRPPRRLPSDFEPEDRDHFLRWPGSAGRRFNFEWRLFFAAFAWPEAVPPGEEVENLKIRSELVQRQANAMRAYLRWRLRLFQKEHPEVPPPNELILIIRLYELSPPGRPPTLTGPDERIVARWLPAEPDDKDDGPAEMYNPLSKRFEKVARD